MSNSRRRKSSSVKARSAPATGGQSGEASPALAAESASSRPGGAGLRTQAWLVSGFLVLAVAIVFGQTLGHPFTGYDDGQFVYDNPHVASGVTWSGLWWALTDGPFGEWTPLSTFSQMLDCQLYGLEPAGHYLTNLLLHAASSVLLFWVLLRMTSQRAVPTVAEASGARAALAGPSATNQRAVPTVAEASGARAAQRARAQQTSERCPQWQKRAARGPRQRARAQQTSERCPQWQKRAARGPR